MFSVSSKKTYIISGFVIYQFMSVTITVYNYGDGNDRNAIINLITILSIIL